MEGTIAIIPVGPLPRSVCEALGKALQARLDHPFEVLPGLVEPTYAHNPARDQYHASAIVRRVSNAVDPARHLVGVGVTDVDLFLPDAHFVFGDADRDARAAVCSVRRLRPSFNGEAPDRARMLRRAVTECLHNVGHVLGLPNCTVESCAMYPANTLSDVDRKREGYCDACKNKLVQAGVL